MYALVEYKGKQYKAEKGALLQVDKIDAEQGSTVTIDTVVLVNNDGNVAVGTPYVAGAKVTVKVEDTFKDDKVIVDFKYDEIQNFRKVNIFFITNLLVFYRNLPTKIDNKMSTITLITVAFITGNAALIPPTIPADNNISTTQHTECLVP